MTTYYTHPHALIRTWTERQEQTRAAYYAETTRTCRDCPELAEPGVTRCHTHREAAAERDRRRTQETP